MIHYSTNLRHDAATACCLGARRFDGGTSGGVCVGCHAMTAPQTLDVSTVNRRLMMKPFLIASLVSALLMLPQSGIVQADPRESARDGHDRAYRDSDPFEGRQQDRQEAREFRKDQAEMERELRKAVAERDRELAKAQAEARREGKPAKFREKRAEIWQKYEEKRHDIIGKFAEKHPW